MFSKLILKNFRSLTDVEIDFTEKANAPKNMIFMYGENGSGKSNIIQAFSILKESISTLNKVQDFMKLKARIQEEADVTSFSDNSGVIAEFLSNRLNNLNLGDLIKNTKTIASKGNMLIKYCFVFNEVEGTYELEFNSDNSLVSEKLYYLIDKRRGELFSIRYTEDMIVSNFNKKLFIDHTLKEELDNFVEQYWGNHTFLSIVNNAIHTKNSNYINKSINKNLLEFILFITDSSVCYRTGNYSSKISQRVLNPVFTNLISGEIDKEDIQDLDEAEGIVREYLMALYSDINNVYYKKSYGEEDEIQYKLILKKFIGNKEREIPCSLESSGTKSILELLPMLLSLIYGGTVIIDEMELGIHDLLISKLIAQIAGEANGQLIVTSHNTNTMNSLKPSNIYTIRTDTSGQKTIKSINNLTGKRIQKNNNLQDMFLAGFFHGVPNPDDVNFKVMLEKVVGNSRDSL
ncbi:MULTISPECIES: AAA family ATPase [Listeria]|uniref:AAA family ATPase n=1 Tax=Listeria TaxID=1637 RepID=UPI0016241FF0|nr:MULTISPECIES: AAA family ATPase [Listeria]MBC1434904.1 ATP-binding protein [Listeria rocourtiae]